MFIILLFKELGNAQADISQYSINKWHLLAYDAETQVMR